MTRPAFAPPAPLEALLQAILAPEPLAHCAFEEWRRFTQLESLPDAHFRLLGELATVIDRLDAGWPGKPRVRGVQKYCWSNNIHILRTALPVLDRLIASRIRFVLLKGGGIIAREPDAIHWRMLRDIDLLVATSDISAAAEILLAAGWRPVTGRLPGRLRAQPFDRLGPANPHAPTRIEIDLHHRVLHPGRYGDFDADFIDRSHASTLLNRQVRSPNVVDQALTALSQALMFSENPSYVWVGDAVRAMRASAFDWSDFWTRVNERDILLHAWSVVSYLRDTFAVPVPNMPAPEARIGRIKRALHEAEISAMGRSRTGRGLRGRLAMLVAESLRSPRVRRRVGFRTDYTVDMRRDLDLPRPLKHKAEGLTWEAVPEPRGGISILVRFSVSAFKRLDFDLWAGERWLRRLKLRSSSGPCRGPQLWRARVTDVEPAIIQVLKLALASNSNDARSHLTPLPIEQDDE